MFYKGDFDIKETWSEVDQNHISSRNNNNNPTS